MAKSRSSRSGIGTAVPPDVVDHRLVNGKAGIGVDDLVAFIDQREHGENMMGLPPGTTTTSSGMTSTPRERLT